MAVPSWEFKFEIIIDLGNSFMRSALVILTHADVAKENQLQLLLTQKQPHGAVNKIQSSIATLK